MRKWKKSLVMGILMCCICSGCGKENNVIESERNIDIPTVSNELEDTGNGVEMYYKALEEASWGEEFIIPTVQLLYEEEGKLDYVDELMDKYYGWIDSLAKGEPLTYGTEGGGVGRMYPTSDEPQETTFVYDWELEEEKQYRVMLAFLHNNDGGFHIWIEDQENNVIWEKSDIEKSCVFYFNISPNAAKHCTIHWKRQWGEEARMWWQENYVKVCSWIVCKVAVLTPEEVAKTDGGNEIVIDKPIE